MSAFRASILGGVDGIITSFAISAGASAGGLGSRVVLVIGVSSVLADGLSMGISEYLSSSGLRAERKSRNEIIQNESSPVVLGLSCFVSFVLCGALPIATYLLTQENLLSCAMFSVVGLMLLGSVRTFFSREPLLLGLVQTSLLGSAAGGVAYGVGYALHDLG